MNPPTLSPGKMPNAISVIGVYCGKIFQPRKNDATPYNHH